jgi:hypothetical protein
VFFGIPQDLKPPAVKGSHDKVLGLGGFILPTSAGFTLATDWQNAIFALSVNGYLITVG